MCKYVYELMVISYNRHWRLGSFNFYNKSRVKYHFGLLELNGVTGSIGTYILSIEHLAAFHFDKQKRKLKHRTKTLYTKPKRDTEPILFCVCSTIHCSLAMNPLWRKF